MIKLSRHTGLSILALTVLLGAVDAAAAQPGPASGFDHFTTGFRLEGAHAMAACDACHVGGTFVGTSTHCSGCHSNAGNVRASTQPSHHISTTQRCESCHRPYTWVPVTRVDHLETFGTCGSCHDGRRAPGQPADHLPTGNQCDNCHRSNAWTPAQFDHVGIVGGCFSCHNGIVAMGKPMDHIPAPETCEDCHGTTRWR